MPLRHEALPPETRPGPVALTIPNLARALPFYQQVLGLTSHYETRENGWPSIHLSAGGQEVVVLVEDPQAPLPPPRAAGLYHLAILAPSRVELARVLRRLLEARWPLQGFANHGVSEAIYLADPVGNGIEVYRDLPREDWPRRAGQIEMTSDPLDVEGLLAELPAPSEPGASLDEATVLGHIHLKVSDLNQAEDFYHNVLGFDLVQRYGRQAAFFSVGGYHHHVGMNTWESAGGPPRPDGARGLRYYTLRLPGPSHLDALLERLQAAGAQPTRMNGGWLVYDPSNNGILLTAATG